MGDSMNIFVKKILFPALTFISVFIFILHFINGLSKTANTVQYTLKSYKNTVALYRGEEIIKIYNNIVLNTLPKKDIQNFNSGIPVATETQAEAYLEDFDG